MDAQETQPDQRQRLARLAFAGVIATIVIIYVVRNVDRYQEINTEFRFSELVERVEPIKDTIETELLSGRVVDMDFLDSGQAGLPDEVLVSDEHHGISVIDGRIFATWKSDESELEGLTYILTPSIDNGDVDWALTGTCRGKKACKKL